MPGALGVAGVLGLDGLDGELGLDGDEGVEGAAGAAPAPPGGTVSPGPLYVPPWANRLPLPTKASAATRNDVVRIFFMIEQ